MPNYHPPKYFRRFFRWFCHADYYEELAGDIEEVFYEDIATKGLAVAKKNYRKEIIKLFRPSVIKEIRWPFSNQITPAMSVSYTHLRAHETRGNLVCRLLLEKKN